jgi:hypothetical protein
VEHGVSVVDMRPLNKESRMRTTSSNGTMKRLWHLAILLLVPLSVSGNSILASDDGYFGYRIGGSSWTEFTAKLNAASGGSVFLTANFENLTEMLNYDALLLPARDQPDTLSAAEVAAISAFIATGRRVVLFGENDNWRAWDQQIVAIAGGTYIAEPYDAYWGYSSSILSNEITNSADSILGFWVGVADGGTQLYSNRNFVTLWGGSQNVLTILDENVVEDAYQAGFGDDAQFTTNVANWLAGGPAAVPAPGTFVLVALGLVALRFGRRERA